LFSVPAGGFQCGDTQRILRGSLMDGTNIPGKDAFKINGSIVF
jgi:hypothetical protein